MKLFKLITSFAAIILTFSIAASAFAQEINKRVEIDLTNQRLYAYEGDTLIYNFIISSGKPWWATPTGTFKPWTKITSQRMRGGSKFYGTYYDLPNVPHVVYFYKDYAIHGAYWHNNFGTPMSHGCVNLTIPDSQKLFNWIEYSTPITIYGKTPT